MGALRVGGLRAGGFMRSIKGRGGRRAVWRYAQLQEVEDARRRIVMPRNARLNFSKLSSARVAPAYSPRPHLPDLVEYRMTYAALGLRAFEAMIVHNCMP